MKVKELISDRYSIVAVMDGNECPAEDFILHGEDSTKSSREGLATMLATVAELGFGAVSPKWVHEANKAKKIYEFRKGDLRLFFFKGKNGQIAVCTTGFIKDGPKADKASVDKAAKFREGYFAAIENNNLEVVRDEDE